MRKIGLWLMVFAALCVNSAAQNSDDVLSVKLLVSVDKLQVGMEHPIALSIDIKEPYHINSESPTEDFLIPTLVSFTSMPGVTFGYPEYPAAEMRNLSFSEMPLEVYEGHVVILCTLRLDPGYEGTELPVQGAIQYQACDDSACLPPAELDFQTVFAVASEGETINPAHVDIFASRPVRKTESPDQNVSVQVQTGKPQTLNDRSLFVSFILIFLGGLGLNLTPCVYPLIPITIGYFGGQAHGKKGGVIAHAVLYVLGMAVTYSILGLVAAMTGSLFGAALQMPLVLIGIALVMVALALSMFGLYEFRLPSFLTNMAGGSKKGFFGSFLMGLTVGIVAAPCIGPFVLGLLTYVGEMGNPLLGFLMFFVLALGLGVPFLFLAIFSGSIDKLPRSGAWMVWVRSIFGFILIGMAIYFLRPYFPNTLAYHLTLSLALFIGGIFLAWMEPTKIAGKVFPVIRNLVGMVFFAAALIFATNGIQSYVKDSLAEARANAGLADLDQIRWFPGSVERLEQAVAKGRPVFIDFYADWCIPCKELDKFTFPDPEVVELSHKFLMLKVDLTGSGNPMNERLKNRFSVKGVPTLLLLYADGTEALDLREVGFIEKDVLLDKMQKVLENR